MLFTTPLRAARRRARRRCGWSSRGRAGCSRSRARSRSRTGSRDAGRASPPRRVMALSPWWAVQHRARQLGRAAGRGGAVGGRRAPRGRRRAALALLTAAALMRPEAWPFLGAYGFWLWRDERRFVIAAGATVLLLWFGPDVLGAGGALDASKTGRGVPSPGSAKLADIPVLALLWDTAILLTVPAVIAAAFARGRTRGADRAGRGGVGGDRGGDDGRGLRGQPALPRGRRRARHGAGGRRRRPRRDRDRGRDAAARSRAGAAAAPRRTGRPAVAAARPPPAWARRRRARPARGRARHHRRRPPRPGARARLPRRGETRSSTA